jgi:hypothetical protein
VVRIRGEKVPHQVAVTIRAPLAQGRDSDVSRLLEELRQCVDRDGGPFRGMAGVHFARVFLMPCDTGPAGEDVPVTLVYMGEVDAPVRAHMFQLADEDSGPLAALLAGCEGYPGDRPFAHRLRWLEEHRVDAAATYVHCVGRGLRQVQDEARLRQQVEDFLDAPGQDWAAASATEVHRAVRDFVRGREDLAWALQPAPPPGLPFRVRERLHKVGLPALAVALSPALLAVLPVWAVLIRRLEMRDESETGRPSPEWVAELTKLEDFTTQNPFTAAGHVKPGFVRQTTITVVLRGLDYFNRHVFNRDNLAGVRTIHFARWVPIDGGRRLIFASNYDGSQESYMDDFIDRLSWGLNAVFSNGVGYPATRWLLFGGARQEQEFKAYLRNHQLPSVWYTAYGDLTARNIDDNTRLRDGLTRELGADEAQSWLALL